MLLVSNVSKWEKQSNIIYKVTISASQQQTMFWKIPIQAILQWLYRKFSTSVESCLYPRATINLRMLPKLYGNGFDDANILRFRRGPCTFEGEWVNIISSRTCWWNEYGTTRWFNDFIAANASDVVPFFPSFMKSISNTWSTMNTQEHRPIKLECYLGTGCQGFQDDIPKTNGNKLFQPSYPCLLTVSASDDEINLFLVLTALQQFGLLQQLNYQVSRQLDTSRKG